MADDGNASTTQSQTTDEKAAASAPAPLSTEGTNGVPDDPTLSAPAREKTVTANEDGTDVYKRQALTSRDVRLLKNQIDKLDSLPENCWFVILNAMDAYLQPYESQLIHL